MSQIPACLQLRSVTKGLIQYAEAMKFENYKHGAHVCLWAPQEGSSSFGQLRAAVMVSSTIIMVIHHLLLLLLIKYISEYVACTEVWANIFEGSGCMIIVLALYPGECGFTSSLPDQARVFQSPLNGQRLPTCTEEHLSTPSLCFLESSGSLPFLSSSPIPIFFHL